MMESIVIIAAIIVFSGLFYSLYDFTSHIEAKS